MSLITPGFKRKPISNLDLLADAAIDSRVQCLALSLMLFICANNEKTLHVNDLAKRFHKPISRIEEALYTLSKIGYQMKVSCSLTAASFLNKRNN